MAEVYVAYQYSQRDWQPTGRAETYVAASRVEAARQLLCAHGAENLTAYLGEGEGVLFEGPHFWVLYRETRGGA